MSQKKEDKSQKPEQLTARRSVITGAGIAAAGLAVAATSAQAQRRTTFVPARHAEDAWLDDAIGSHRVFIDSASAEGGSNAVLYASNLLAAHTGEFYSGAASDMDIVVCFRHLSTPYGYNDAMWKKYGEMMINVMAPVTPPAETPTAHPLDMQAPNGMQLGVGLLARQGVRFAICRAATQFFSGQLAQATGQDMNDVFEELLANAIDSSRFFSAGVMAATRAQEYGYSLLYSA
jgi:hypothetical protein